MYYWNLVTTQSNSIRTVSKKLRSFRVKTVRSPDPWTFNNLWLENVNILYSKYVSPVGLIWWYSFYFPGVYVICLHVCKNGESTISTFLFSALSIVYPPWHVVSGFRRPGQPWWFTWSLVYLARPKHINPARPILYRSLGAEAQPPSTWYRSRSID